MPIKLDTPVQYVKGVGPKRAAMLAGAGIRTVEDLLKHKPFRYEDRTNFRRIRELRPDGEALISAGVAVTGRYTTPMKRVQIFEMVVSDSSGSMHVKFFNQPYLDRVFRKGQEVILYGAPRYDDYGGGIVFINPDYEIIDSDADQRIHTGRIVPVYRKVGQLTAKAFRQILFQLFKDLESEIEDPLPSKIRRRYDFPERRKAFELIHFPECPSEATREGCLEELLNSQTPAHRRLIFEEFFFFHLGLQVMKKQREVLPKHRTIKIRDRIREVIKSILPFHPTQAQKRVLRQIADDLCSAKTMNRLLQGDVGSGKTIVALQAMIIAIENGYQTALMAPTEILAEQHHQNIRDLLSDTSYRVVLLTSSIKGKARKTVLSQIKSGEAHIVIGTHALIQGGVEFSDLAFVVVDEQHRFGVIQRSLLMEKGDRPDTLVMTATPIPRSLALTLYGDLDLSIIDEMPPGRQPIRTVIKTEKSREEVYSLIRQEVKKGRQVYVVYPIIEESEKIDLKAATEGAEHLQHDVFPEFTVGLMHGRLKPDGKDEIMHRFKHGEIQILVSTTVIEVGIDVPNATLMSIENAERFGLSQLHQLRGRIGRGSHASGCILMSAGGSREAWERLDIMRRTNDGFKIAEKDLEIRGPGEFVGTRQWGVPEFLFGNIVRDRELLEAARQEAENYLVDYLKVSDEKKQEIMAQVAALWKEKYGLYTVG